MPKSNILKALEELDKEDIYSLILFVLYRLKFYFKRINLFIRQ